MPRADLEPEGRRRGDHPHRRRPRGRCTMMTSADAKAFARIQHAGQVDKVGAPYVEHLERVAFAAEHRAQQARDLSLAVDPDAVVQAAWLHDVIEDTPVTADELRGAGYAAAVVEMGELRVEARHDPGQELVAGVPVRDPGQPQLLDQPVL